MSTRYDRMTPEEIEERTKLSAMRRKNYPDAMSKNPHEDLEKRAWHHLREEHARRGRSRVHPAFRLYPTWEDFIRAGKPWHNHNEPGERHMCAGDHARGWEDDRFRKYPRMWEPQYREYQGLRPTPQNPSVAYGGIPAGVLMQMMADANGGLGADWITPGSPERQVQAYMDSVRNNGIKMPGNLRLA